MSSSPKRAWVDVFLGALGVAVGWSSLTFPFGRDQGLFFYVAREWLKRGSIPYRDVFDDQTPGIYGVHAIAIGLFGETMWGIRVLDLIAVIAIGVLAASFSAPPNRSPARGIRGASVLTTSILYYGFSNFWNTAQVEIWYSAFALASIWAARNVARPSRAEFFSGLLGGMAIVMKPPAAWFVACALTICIARSLREKDRRVTLSGFRFVAGVAVPIAITLAYFAAHDALGTMAEVIIGAGGYVGRESSIDGVGGVINATLDGYRFYSPLAALIFAALIIGMAWHHKRSEIVERNRYAFAALLGVLGFLAVAVQKRFFLFHWSVMIGPAVIVVANAILDIEKVTREHPQRVRIHVAAVVVILAAWMTSGDSFRGWVDENRSAASYIAGRIDRATFTRRFSLDVLDFSYRDSERVGLWLEDHSSADDSVAVRGFEPEIYAIAHRHYTGRFFWTIFLTSPTHGFHQVAWQREDASALDARPPRFVVAIERAHVGPDAPETFLLRGYRVATQISGFVILERPQ
ncbi:MAG: hypothetical protein ABI183_05295 [Polyangiaceae bacterium]